MLPKHLQESLDKFNEKVAKGEAKPFNPGTTFIVTDVTPEGYGPIEEDANDDEQLTETDEIYAEVQTEARMNIDNLQWLLKNHTEENTRVNYGHIGDIRHINELLRQAVSFLNGEGGE